MFRLEDVEVGRDLVIAGNEIHLPPEPPPPRDQRWLDALRAYVEREVEQWLTDEIGRNPLLRVNKQELSEAVGQRTPVLVRAPERHTEDRADRLLAADETLGDVFAEEAGRSLLVLGEPGSGKSVLLRRLARDLLARSAADPGEPVPVLLDLAGWVDDGRSFVEWLAGPDGLRRSYRSTGGDQLRAWLREGRLTLLLDGFDEVRAEHRAACAETINAFVAGAGGGAPGGLVVCSRVDEYHAVAREVGPLSLSAAIYLQPLTEEQVSHYLDEAGPNARGLRAAWEKHASVRELARNPLMLSTMSLAFEHTSLTELSEEPVLDTLVEAYVERVFERAEERVERRASPEALPEPDLERVFEGQTTWMDEDRDALPYGRAMVRETLGWLARRLREHGRSTFYVEELQPSWLEEGQRWRYLVASRCAGGIVLGVVAGALLLLGLGASGSLFGGAGEAAGTGGLIVALSLAGAFLAGALDAEQFARGATVSSIGRRMRRGAVVLAMGGLGGGLFWAVGQRGAYGVLFGVLWGAVVLVVFQPGADWRAADRDIRLVEPLRWSRRSAWRAAVRGLGGGALVGAVLGGLVVWSMTVSPSIPVWAIVAVTTIAAGGLTAVVGGALGGLKHGSVRAAPRHNLGLRLSIRNAWFAGTVTALAALLVLVVLTAASGALGVEDVARLSLGGGLFCGLLAALRYGGLNAVYHAALRVILARRGVFPRGAAPFFRFVADLSLMRRAGGGYLFAHRIFADYFAAHTDAAVPQPPHPEVAQTGSLV